MAVAEPESDRIGADGLDRLCAERAGIAAGAYSAAKAAVIPAAPPPMTQTSALG